MIALLAAADTAKAGPLANLFDTVVQLFSHGDTLAQPQQLVHSLQALSVVWSVVFLIVGLLCLLNGYKYYRVATIIMAFLIGAFAGYWLGQKIQAPFIVAGCLGILLAVAAFPMMKYAVALLGGLAGAFLGANLWSGFAHALNHGAHTHIPDQAFWIGALVGLIVCGMLAFVVFKLSIVLFTSVSGATLAVFGALALLLSFKPWEASVAQGITASQLVVPLLVVVPAAIGLIIQHSGPPAAAAGPQQGPKKA